jgi:acyl dehydratase
VRFAAFKPGLVIEAGPRLIGAEEIIEFASRYDPQWFHTDPERAAKSRWKGLIASGWHSSAILMEMAVAAILKDSESFGSPGIERLEWLEAVRPGDALRMRVEVHDARRSSSGRTGIVRWQWELWNQHGVKVLSLVATSLFDLGPAEATGSERDT